LSVLGRRILSGFVIGLVTLPVVYLGGMPFFVAVFAGSVLAGHEYQRMLAHAGHRSFYGLQLGLTAFLLIGTLWLSPEAILGGITLSLILSLAWQVGRRHESEQPFADWALSLAGALYVGWLFAHFLMLRGLPGGLGWVLLALFSTWVCDSFAYIFGKAWGKHPFFPRISPRKTWEGAVAGWVGGTGTALLVGWVLGLSFIQALTLGLAISLAATFGDLVESMIKRQFGVKDSGSLLPGHGGILDRVDSLLFVSVVAYYLLVWVVRI
jgi:phosphatidate cytidylyltransferase